MQAASLDHEISFSPVKEAGFLPGPENGLETRTALFLSEPAALLSGPLLRISGIKNGSGGSGSR